MVAPLLTAHDSTGHVHLIVGSNPLANARCSKSLEVGAKPIIVAKGTSHMHYALQKKIEDGAVQWLDKDFEDSDLQALGREEVDRVVDAVFVTKGSSPLST
jgi:uroporphyrin-III C-methyltransferase